MTALHEASVSSLGPGDAGAHRDRLAILTCGLRLARVIGTLAELEVADVLAAGPLPVTEIAARVGADPDALHRVLRLAASFGVFVETAPGTFGPTGLAGPTRSGVPYSLRPLIEYGLRSFVAEPYASLTEVVRTGAPATDFWAHLRAHPADEAFFDRMMTELGQWETDRHLDVIDPARFDTLADLGGGHGHFLAAALRRAPATRGVLVEHPAVLADAAAVLGDLTARVDLRPGDLFRDDLPQADAYVLKAVLHNWPDADVATLLARVRERDRPLFVVEQVVGTGNGFDHGKVLDVDMLVLFGGRERTLAQWRETFAAAGFALANTPDTGRWTVLVAEPV